MNPLPQSTTSHRHQRWQYRSPCYVFTTTIAVLFPKGYFSMVKSICDFFFKKLVFFACWKSLIFCVVCPGSKETKPSQIEKISKWWNKINQDIISYLSYSNSKSNCEWPYADIWKISVNKVNGLLIFWISSKRRIEVIEKKMLKKGNTCFPLLKFV